MGDFDERKERELFAERLRYWLNLKGVSQQELCEYLNVSKSSVSLWCSGAKMPRMGKIQAIADFLKINKSDLVDLPGNSIEIVQDELFEKRKLLFDISNKADEKDLDKIINIVNMVVGDKNE